MQKKQRTYAEYCCDCLYIMENQELRRNNSLSTKGNVLLMHRIDYGYCIACGLDCAKCNQTIANDTLILGTDSVENCKIERNKLWEFIKSKDAKEECKFEDAYNVFGVKYRLTQWINYTVWFIIPENYVLYGILAVSIITLWVISQMLCFLCGCAATMKNEGILRANTLKLFWYNLIIGEISLFFVYRLNQYMPLELDMYDGRDVNPICYVNALSNMGEVYISVLIYIGVNIIYIYETQFGKFNIILNNIGNYFSITNDISCFMLQKLQNKRLFHKIQ